MKKIFKDVRQEVGLKRGNLPKSTNLLRNVLFVHTFDDGTDIVTRGMRRRRLLYVICNVQKDKRNST